ncbi:MAG: formylglycine-generating enzyme family protein [Polyangiaceae bacterium]|nr:formylglycine-generating enzyme family protein [Polyangiaceae bacterium]
MRFRALAAGVVVAACAASPEVRPQHVLSVDTDLPALGTPGVNVLAAVDTLRIDVYALDDMRLVSTRDFVVSDVSNWPLTLGVAGAARVRLRAYRARTATPSTLEPDPALTVDRLVDLSTPRVGVDVTQVVLRGDCIGYPADLGRGLSCIDGASLHGLASSGLGPPSASSQVGSWPGAVARPCTARAPEADVACIPGGYDIVGQSDLLGIKNQRLEAFPVRPVIVGAVYMDRTEYTVGRFRRQLARPWLPAAHMPDLPSNASPVLQYCTFIGADDGGNDVLPLNCVDSFLAAELCALDGGQLPSEAEWEHAARGGDGRTYTWGAEPPRCCTASTSRDPTVDGGAVCLGKPVVEPVGSHPGNASCLGDVTPRGIVDLGGSLSELTRDRFASAGQAWSIGLARDPVSVAPIANFVAKGGNFSAGVELTRPAYRDEVAQTLRASIQGFRCVYRGESP